MVSIASEPAASAPATLGFRPEIEGLRGIAVSLVVAFHAGVPGLSGGFIGVDVFFVISGYLISGLLIKEHRQKGRIDFIRFYARRARRLLPAGFLMIAVTLVVASIIVSPLEYRELSKAGISAALSMSNIWFALNTADYFGTNIHESFLLHTWSLAVEEQFYLIWPAIIAVLTMTVRSTRRCIWVFACLSAVALFACAVMTKYQSVWAFYGTPFRVWEFGAGAIAYLLPVPGNARTSRIFTYLGVGLIVGSSVFFNNAMAFPGVVALAPVLGTCLVLCGYSGAPTAIPNQLLRTRPMQVLGTISYSWYLWHWPFLTLGAIALPGPSTPGKVLTLVVASFLAASISFVFFENPIRRHQALVRGNVRSLVLGAALIFAAAGGSWMSYGIAKTALAEPVQLAIAQASRGSSRDCLMGFGGTSPHTCIFGSDDARTTIVLIGDSHAHQWIPAIRAIAEQRQWRLITFLKSACPTPDVRFYYLMLKREYEECPAWRDNAIKHIQALKPSVVFMVNSSMGYVGEPGSGRSLTYDDWRNGMHRMLDRLANLDAANIILLHDNPRPGISTLTCLSRAAFQRRDLADACVVDRSNAVDDKLFAAEREVLVSHANTHIINLTDWFCTETRCHTYRDGMVIYRDSNHLTLDTVLALRPAIEQELLAVISDGHLSAKDVEEFD